MIDRRDYKRKPKNHAVAINIQLRCVLPKGKPTRAMVEEVLDEILTNNTVPAGWQVAFIQWGNPTKSSTNWRQGKLGDISAFEQVIRDERTKLGILRMRKGEPPPEEI